MLTATITVAAWAVKVFQPKKQLKFLFHFCCQPDERHLKDAVLRLES